MPDVIRHPVKISQLLANGCYWIPFSKKMTGRVKGGSYGRKTL